MLTQEQVLEDVKNKKVESECLDGRDFYRLAEFFTPDKWPDLGMQITPGTSEERIKELQTPKPWTEEEVKKQLAQDVAFGFEKALNKRGISSSFMHSVVKMWMWVLDDHDFDAVDYPMYGLPLLKGVAVKYGFPNPIGADSGSEEKYDEGGE